MLNAHTYHDVLPLDLSLFLSQFFSLHLQAVREPKAKNWKSTSSKQSTKRVRRRRRPYFAKNFCENATCEKIRLWRRPAGWISFVCEEMYCVQPYNLGSSVWKYFGSNSSFWRPFLSAADHMHSLQWWCDIHYCRRSQSICHALSGTYDHGIWSFTIT